MAGDAGQWVMNATDTDGSLHPGDERRVERWRVPSAASCFATGRDLGAGLSTSSGRGGSPTAQIAGTSFQVTVYATDSSWNLTTSNHQVTITTSNSGRGRRACQHEFGRGDV